MIWILINKFKGYIIGAGIILASILGIYLKGRNDGAENAEDKAREALEDDVQSHKRIEHNINSLDDTSVTDKLSDWTRKG